LHAAISSGSGLRFLGGPALHDVADVDVVALKSHRADHAVEQLAGLADEGKPLAVFVRAGASPMKQSSASGAAAREDGLGARGVKRTLGARANFGRELDEANFVGRGRGRGRVARVGSARGRGRVEVEVEVAVGLAVSVALPFISLVARGTPVAPLSICHSACVRSSPPAWPPRSRTLNVPPPSAPRYRSDSSAAMQPVPAAVTACRNTQSCTSPQANTPGTLVCVVPGVVLM